ncbi:hypothetical protein ACFWGI_35550 [Streptomyces niveus]|uniref:hypothetical protein n=1 Tax=Streptomyces niveus TaxID=193462 RepID=UPI0036653C8E
MLDHITPGLINEHAVEAFLYGGCAALALAIHDATGWPITAVIAEDGLELHYAISHFDGLLIDILGARTEDDVLLTYEFHADGGAVRLTDATAADIEAWHQNYGETVPMHVAQSFVPTVLNQAHVRWRALSEARSWGAAISGPDTASAAALGQTTERRQFRLNGSIPKH